jgi:hypothetical protein
MYWMVDFFDEAAACVDAVVDALVVACVVDLLVAGLGGTYLATAS